MCIICNLTAPQNDVGLAEAFLGSFRRAGDEMRKAEAALLSVAEKVAPEDRTRYRRVHKQLVRLRRDWNRIEQQRERP